MSEKELTTPEIRKLIKAHNVLMSITIPPRSTREQILKILDDKGYMVNHVRKSIQRRYGTEKKPNVTLKQADKILKKPEKTALQKQKAEESKAKKAELQKKKERELKKDAVKKAMTNKPVVKKPVAKKPVKKPMKKEDDVRPAKTPYPTIPPNVKGKRIPKGQLLLQDKKKGQKVVKQPVKISMKDKLIEKDKKEEADKKKAVQQKKKDKIPYKPSSDEGSLKDKILKLTDYFVEDKNKVGNIFKTVKEVNTAIGDVFSSVKGTNDDALDSLSISERKYFIRLMNSMLRFSTQERTGVEVTKTALRKYKGWYSETASEQGKKTQKAASDAPAKLEKKLLKTGSQLEDKPAIRAREKAEREKKKAKEDAKKGVKKESEVKEVVSFEEESSHSDTLKNARKTIYRIINQAIADAMKINPKDFVEINQKTKFYSIYNDKYSDIYEELDDDDMEIFEEEWDDVLDPEFEKQLEIILEKNRKSTGWAPSKPVLKKLQNRYIRLSEEGKTDSADSVKKQILKHYSASDVPSDKPKFKIDQSKQPKQTPSKVDIKIKPESNTKKIEPKINVPKVNNKGILVLKKYDVIEYKTTGNKKVVAYVADAFAKNTYRMNNIILEDNGSFDESEDKTLDLPDLVMTAKRKIEFIGRLIDSKVIFSKKKEPKKVEPKKKEPKKKKEKKVSDFKLNKYLKDIKVWEGLTPAGKKKFDKPIDPRK